MESIKPKRGETREEWKARMADRQEEIKADARRKLAVGETQVVFEIDDYGFLLPGHDALLAMRKSFPDFKVTAFTIPFPKEFFTKENAKHFSWKKYERWAEMVNSLDWLEVAAHGFAHTHFECACGYGDAITMIEAVEKLFARVGLDYVKIWRCPYWQSSYSFLTALRDKGWVAAINRNFPQPAPEGLETYTFGWSVEEPFPDAGKPTVFGHAHFHGNNANNLLPNLGNVLRELPTGTKFGFLSEHYGDTKQ